MHTDGNPPIKSTATSLDIVEAVNQRDGATLSELANRFDKPKSTVHDHLQTLTDAGYLAKESREFRVSVRFLILSDTGT